MKTIKTKLAGRRGSSMLIALLLFVLCAFAGTAALTAASSGAGRVVNGRADQQGYLTVASAARLLREELDGASFTARYTMREYYYVSGWEDTEESDAQGNPIQTPVYSDGVDFPDYGHDLSGTDLSDLLNDDCWALFCSRLPAEFREDAGYAAGALEARTLTIETTVALDGYNQLEAVRAVWRMNPDYSLTIQLSLADGSCPMTLTAAPSPRQADAQLRLDTWTQAGGGSSGGHDDGFTRYSAAIQWPAADAEIERGVA